LTRRNNPKPLWTGDGIPDTDSACPLQSAPVELEAVAAGKVRAMVRHNIGKIYGFEFLNLTPEQTQQIRERCKLLPLYRGKTLGI
jgi:hypothetical protein